MKRYIKLLVLSVIISLLFVFSTELQISVNNGIKFYQELEKEYVLLWYDKVFKFILDYFLPISLTLNIILLNIVFNLFGKIYQSLRGLLSKIFNPPTP